MARILHTDPTAEANFNEYDVTRRGNMNIEGMIDNGAGKMRTPVDHDKLMEKELEEFHQKIREKLRNINGE